MRNLLAITVLLTFSQFRPNSSFSVQKRRTQSPSDLRNALEVLRRKRRRIDDDSLQNLYRDISDQYLPYDEYLPYRYGGDRDDEDINDQYVFANMLDSYPRQDSVVKNRDENLVQSSDKETPTLNEIKEIFNEIDKSEKKKNTNAKSDQSVDKISPEEMDQLLSEAVKVPSSEEKSAENDKGKDNAPEPVSTDELKNVFKETEVKDEISPDNKEKLVEIGKEIVATNENNSLKKKKRMTKRDSSDKSNEETLLNLVQEVQELRGKVAQLQLIEYLEDKENDYLASALKSATLAQIRKGEPYLEEEYSEIQKALEIEETLQGLKDSGLVKENRQDQTEPVPEEKRSQTPYADNSGLWYDQPVQEQVDDAQQRLEDFVKQYRETYDVDNLEDENDEEPIQIDPPYSPGLPESEDICPQLDVLSTNCDVASLLEIDEEARDLCNRHEICYICGATVGLSQQDCDGGFRSETVERCNGGKCIQSGAEFLWFIKQDHKYTNSYLEQCDAQCVKGYIVGG